MERCMMDTNDTPFYFSDFFCRVDVAGVHFSSAHRIPAQSGLHLYVRASGPQNAALPL